jgi:cytochrome P450
MASTDVLDVAGAGDTSQPSSATPILDAFDTIAKPGGDPREIAGKQFQFILDQLRGNALAFFQELRDHRPILQSAAATLVARFEDVEEILHREEIFSVSPYLPRMLGVIGPFVLSQDITPRYDRDISIMRLVVRREDLPRVKEIVARHAAAIVGTLFQQPGPVDIVQTLTRKVPVRLAEEYLGFSAASDRQMMSWARAGFREFFINLLDNPVIRAPAVAAGDEMRQRLDALLAERRSAVDDARDDVMARLLRLQRAGDFAGLDDDTVCRTLGGLIIGMVETTSQAAVHALLMLFPQP